MSTAFYEVQIGTGGPAFRCRAIIFDLDGTLIDTAADLADAVDGALADLGLPPAGEARVRDWVGEGAPVLLRRALDAAGAPEFAERALCLFGEHYAAGFTKRSRLYRQVERSLKRLHALGLPLAVCTNKPSRFVPPLLEHFGIAGYFSATVGGDELPVKKPDPGTLLHISNLMEAAPAECLVVGDSRNDVQAARAAGMPVIAVSYGYNHGADIRDSRPDGIVDSIGELKVRQSV